MTKGSLRFEAVSLRYASARTAGASAEPVLRAIDLAIGRGEFLTVLGRSGAGKTSLLNLAAGFLKPTEGRITLDGRTVDGPAAERAVVFQDDALMPWLDVGDNVALPLRLRGASPSVRRARSDELLARVGLAGQARRHVWELSGGQRQRVGIARALAAEPSFLLMDEPLGALDAMTRERMQEVLLRTWRTSGAGALLITHSIEEAIFLGTRVLVLTPGPGRITVDRPIAFSSRFLDGATSRAVRADPEFVRARDELTAAIYEGEEIEP